MSDRISEWVERQLTPVALRTLDPEHLDRVRSLAGGFPALCSMSQHPAWEHICQVVEATGKPSEYLTDLYWDAALLNDPAAHGLEFLWGVRDYGTHVILDDQRATFDAVMRSMGDVSWWKWTGRTLHHVTHDQALNWVKSTELGWLERRQRHVSLRVR